MSKKGIFLLNHYIMSELTGCLLVCFKLLRMGQKISKITSSDIYMLADDLLLKHGHEAAFIASMRADESLGLGDMNGYRVWKRIFMLVDEMATFIH